MKFVKYLISKYLCRKLLLFNLKIEDKDNLKRVDIIKSFANKNAR